MAEIAIPLAFQVGGSILQGRSARAAGDFAATQANINAGQAQAASQRQAENEQHRTKLAMSRAQAVAAASGGGATDPTVLDVIGGIAKEGEYRSLLALYEGDDKARELRLRGAAAKAQGRNAQRASYLGAAGSFANAGYTLYQKYGMGGSNWAAADPYADGYGGSWAGETM